MHSHAEEIKYWADYPDRTRVWHRHKEKKLWVLTSSPSWFKDRIYIVDNEWSELRKAQADGKQLQFKYGNSPWIDGTLTLEEIKNYGDNKEWRIKPENRKEPVHKYQWMC